MEYGEAMNMQLTDRFQRRIEYVRLSVTDRCDLRCIYCLPKGFKDFEEPEHWLNFSEIERVIGAFARWACAASASPAANHSPVMACPNWPRACRHCPASRIFPCRRMPRVSIAMPWH